MKIKRIITQLIVIVMMIIMIIMTLNIKSEYASSEERYLYDSDFRVAFVDGKYIETNEYYLYGANDGRIYGRSNFII